MTNPQPGRKMKVGLPRKASASWAAGVVGAGALKGRLVGGPVAAFGTLSGAGQLQASRERLLALAKRTALRQSPWRRVDLPPPLRQCVGGRPWAWRPPCRPVRRLSPWGQCGFSPLPMGLSSRGGCSVGGVGGGRRLSLILLLFVLVDVAGIFPGFQLVAGLLGVHVPTRPQGALRDELRGGHQVERLALLLDRELSGGSGGR